jgi:exopolyphosphatase / guanosine-5'-triphosphate,3'-diphosphate pyrophosphatase
MKTGSKVAAIDAGTNTFRLLVGNRAADGGLRIERIEREITRLGEGLASEGRLGEAAIERSIRCLKKFSDIIEGQTVSRVKAAVTAAARQAANGGDFIKRVREQTKIDLQILPARDEARLTAQGALESVGPVPGLTLLVDIGGGSTEFILLEQESLVHWQSLDTGVVRLFEENLRNDPVTENDMNRLERSMQNDLNRLDGFGKVRAGRPIALVANAGVPTTLAAVDLGLKEYDPLRVNRHRIPVARLRRMTKELAAKTTAERAAIPTMERGRADVILPGASLLSAIAERFGAAEVLISEGGLLEGLALELLKKD